MTIGIILASKSQIRSELLLKAGLKFTAIDANIDEKEVKSSYINKGYSARDLADILAAMKAKKLSCKYLDKLVIGCDQIMECNGQILSKANNPTDLADQLKFLRSKSHTLYSACVVYFANKAEWRFIGSATITMRNLSDEYISKYVDDNWDEVKHCVGGYKIENSGISFLSKINGDYFSILGLPIIQLLDYLVNRGVLKH
tara:strand:- start:1570 stop:2169 length:600 start_codon:yes stop_codon:yes gene_type:complete